MREEQIVKLLELSLKKFRNTLRELSNTTYDGLQHKQPEGTDHPKKAGSGEDE